MNFQELLENAGYETRSYSGRGMFGKQCLAISTDDSPFDVAANLLETSIRSIEVSEVEFDQQHFADILRQTRSDSMGLGSVYYWPSETYESGDEDYFEDEDYE